MDDYVYEPEYHEDDGNIVAAGDTATNVGAKATTLEAETEAPKSEAKICNAEQKVSKSNIEASKSDQNVSNAEPLVSKSEENVTKAEPIIYKPEAHDLIPERMVAKSEAKVSIPEQMVYKSELKVHAPCAEPIVSKPEVKLTCAETMASKSETKVFTCNKETTVSKSEPSISNIEHVAFSSEETVSNTEPMVSKSDTESFTSEAKMSTSDAGASKSDGFLLETKYIMLNFINLVPRDLYADHLICTPPSVSSDMSISDQFWKRPSSKLSKTTSCDASTVHSRPPKLQYLSKQSAFRSLAESEDNVNYRYEQNIQHQGSLHSLPLEPDSPTRFARSDLSKDSLLSNNSPLPLSPLSPCKTPQLLYRLNSDVSSSGDCSLNWDADDEYELSNASSLHSIGSVSFQNGFLNLHRSSPWTPPAIPRQSDVDYRLSEEDEVDGEVPTALDDINIQIDEQPLDRVTNETNVCFQRPLSRNDGSTHGSAHCGRDSCNEITKLDRTKLKLDIRGPSFQLDDTLGSMKTEIDSQMTDIESEFEEVGMERRSPLSPCSEVARRLACIGDEIMLQRGSQFMNSLGSLGCDASQVTYEDYSTMARAAVEGLGTICWRQVALAMVIGQRAAWQAFQHGREQFSNLVNYAAQFVADIAADFIIEMGGWSAVMNLDLSQSSENHYSTSVDVCSPSILDYFTGHNVTQVDSGAHADLNHNSPHPDDTGITSPQSLFTNDMCSKPSFGFEVNEGANTESDKSEHCYTNSSSVSLYSPSSDSLSIDEKMDIRPTVTFGLAQVSDTELEQRSEHYASNQSSTSLTSADSLSIDQMVDQRSSLGFDVAQGASPDHDDLSEHRYSISMVSEADDNIVFDDAYTKNEDVQAAGDSVAIICDYMYDETDVDKVYVDQPNLEQRLDDTDQTLIASEEYKSELNEDQLVCQTCVDVNVAEQNDIQLDCDEISSTLISNLTTDLTEDYIDNINIIEFASSSQSTDANTFDDASNNAIKVDPNDLGLIVVLPNTNTVPQYALHGDGIIHSYSKIEPAASTQLTDDEKSSISRLDGGDTSICTITEKNNCADEEKIDVYKDSIDSNEAKDNTNELDKNDNNVINNESKCKDNASEVLLVSAEIDLIRNISENGRVEYKVTGELEKARDEHLSEQRHRSTVNGQDVCNVPGEDFQLNTSADNVIQETDCSNHIAGDESGGEDRFDQITRMGIMVAAVTVGLLLVSIALKSAFNNKHGWKLFRKS